MRQEQVCECEDLSIDTSEALKVPGVHAVLTAKDIRREPLRACNRDQEVLATDRVRMRATAVALVAAETMDDAEEALYRIKVEYEKSGRLYDRGCDPRRRAACARGCPGNILQHTLVRKVICSKGSIRAII